MRTSMLLWAVVIGLLVAPPVWAEASPTAEDGLGLDFETDLDADLDADEGVQPAAPAPAAETAAPAASPAPASEAQAPIPATPDVATVPAEPTASEDTADGDLAAAEAVDSEPMPAPTHAADSGHAIEIGPMGVDGTGQVGRIHTVSRGDTLWDISNAYLGTPWVWPSIWNDNEGISNPHRIAPGDRIWITAGEMRIVTDEQADELISSVPDELAAEPEVLEDELPAAVGEEDELLEASAPTSMDDLPVAAPSENTGTSRTGAMVRVSEAESLGFVSPDTLEAASSIVGSPEERTWLAEGDRVYIGLGEGQAQVGDEFTIYRDFDEVRDLDGTLLGYHVEVLGWAVVRSTDAESSVAEVRQSQYEMRRGDMVIPRNPVVVNVPVKLSPDAMPGHIIYMPDSRTAMGDGEWVYLDRGSLHGVEQGTEIEVYIPGEFTKDKARREKVLTPDDVVAQMIVVDTQPDSSVAYIVHAERELRVGDKVRPIAPRLANR